MSNQKVSIIQNYFWQKMAKLSEQHFLKKVENQRGFESGPECGGSASVIEPVRNKQDCTETGHVKIPLFSSRLLQKSDSFHLKASFKFSSILLRAVGNKVHVYLIQCSLFCSSALFSNAKSKVRFILCPNFWKFFWMRLDSRRIHHFL